MSIRQETGQRQIPRPDLDSTVGKKRSTAIRLTHEVGLAHDVRQLLADMLEVRQPDVDESDLTLLDDLWIDDFEPELGEDYDNDEYVEYSAPELDEERQWTAADLGQGVAAFGLEITDELIRLVLLIDPEELAQLYPNTVNFILTVIQELELILNERRSKLQRQLASQQAHQLVGVSELAVRLLQRERGEGRDQFLSLRANISALINQESIVLPDGRTTHLSWFFPRHRGSNLPQEEMILSAVQRALVAHPKVGNLTELADVLLVDPDAELRSWIAGLKPTHRRNSISQRLRRLLQQFADDLLEPVSSDLSREQAILAAFVQQVLVDGKRTRRWQRNPTR